MQLLATKQRFRSNLLSGLLGGAVGGSIFTILTMLISLGWQPSLHSVFLLISMVPIYLFGAVIGGMMGCCAGILLPIGYRQAGITAKAKMILLTGICIGLVYPVGLILINLVLIPENTAEISDALAAIPAGIIAGAIGGWVAWKLADRSVSV